MNRPRSTLANILRERQQLLEQLHHVLGHREETLHRLKDVEQRILREEERGPRAYLDHIFGQTPTKKRPHDHF
jgi:hypothetical protein